MEPIKVVLFTNIISPYRIPLFNQLSQGSGFHFKVVALAENEANRKWQIMREQIQFDYQVLPGWHYFIWRRELSIHLNIGLGHVLYTYNPDIIISSGYNNLAYWQAFFYAKIFRKSFILCNESTLLSTHYISGFIGMLKKFIIRHTNAYIAFGEKSREYLEILGAKRDRIYTGIDTVNMEFFRNRSCNYRKNTDFISERKLFPKLLLLFVGQLIPRKGVIQVLRALSYLCDSEIGLIIVGSGHQERELKKFCQEEKLQNIYFEGFHQQEELPRYYALADIFILPSFEEVWGLVVNEALAEALASGLYVLCSKYAGAAYDLIKEGWNGEIFDPNNIGELVMLIKRTKEQIEEIRKRREAISKHACKEFSIERSVQAFLEAIEAAQHT